MAEELAVELENLKEEAATNLDILLGFCEQIRTAIKEGDKDRALYLLQHMEDFLRERPVL